MRSNPHMVERDGVFLADNCTVVGDVTLARNVSVWYGTVIRGDVAPISVGENTNIQDLCMIHPMHGHPVEVGANITVGHCAVIHCSKVGDNCLIGIGAKLLTGSEIGEGSIIAAGAVIPEGAKIPPRSMVMGVPGRVTRQVTDDELAMVDDTVQRYLGYARDHLLD